MRGESYITDETMVQDADGHFITSAGYRIGPREIHFFAALPKTPSGKAQRFTLRGLAQVS